MDGVLVDSGAHHREAWAAMCRDCGLSPPPEFWRLTIGRPAEEAVALLVDGIDRGEARRLADLKREHYTRLARRGAVAVAGAGAFVEALARAGVPRAVATSATRRDLERVLDALGLRRHIDLAITADDVRRGKPHPEVYLKAAEGLGVGNIPHRLRPRLDGWALIVSTRDAEAAREALDAYERENIADTVDVDADAAAPVRGAAVVGVAIGLLLIGFFAVTGTRAGRSIWFERGG